MNFLSLLSPDKNLSMLKIYHKSSIILLPSTILSVFGGLKNENYKYLHYFNTVNYSIHSYISTSCIITDYIKIKNIQYIARIINLKLHVLAPIGIFQFINNQIDPPRT